MAAAVRDERVQKAAAFWSHLWPLELQQEEVRGKSERRD